MKNNCQDKFNLEVGKELKILRLKLNLTQSEMANNIISTPTYSKIERGEARISFNDLVSILKVHRIDLYKFVKKINEYEKFLNGLYRYLSKFFPLEELEWLKKEINQY